MKKILTLTMNPALDVSTGTERVMPERKLRCGPAKRDPGGGGINVARVLKRLGSPARALFPAGGHIGAQLEQLVEGEGVDTLTIPIKGETRENFTARETGTGQQYRFVLAGPEVTASECQSCLEALEGALLAAGLLVASGSLPPGAPPDFYAQVATVAASQKVPFMLDTSGQALAAALGPKLGFIKPNLRELSDLVNADLITEADQIDACRALTARGKVATVALTLGASGGLLVSADGVWQARGPDVEVESAVGAGDSFMGGMAWALGAGRRPEEAFAAGIAAGTAAVLTPGTGLCRADDVRGFIDQVQLEKLSS